MEIAVPAFLRNSVTDILSIGKSVQIIKSFKPNFAHTDVKVSGLTETLNSRAFSFEADPNLVKPQSYHTLF